MGVLRPRPRAAGPRGLGRADHRYRSGVAASGAHCARGGDLVGGFGLRVRRLGGWVHRFRGRLDAGVRGLLAWCWGFTVDFVIFPDFGLIVGTGVGSMTGMELRERREACELRAAADRAGEPGAVLGRGGLAAPQSRGGRHAGDRRRASPSHGALPGGGPARRTARGGHLHRHRHDVLVPASVGRGHRAGRLRGLRRGGAGVPPRIPPSCPAGSWRTGSWTSPRRGPVSTASTWRRWASWRPATAHRAPRTCCGR